MHIRRVATGHDDNGKSIIASDEKIEATTVRLMPGFEFHSIWRGDQPASFPDDGSQPVAPSYFPPLGGFRFGLFTVPPGEVAGLPEGEFEAAAAEFEEKLPGLAAHMEPDSPGMHTTATIDYEYIVSGSITLELDDSSVDLKAGDTVVQNGTRHAWRNKGDVPCVIVVCLIGAEHRAVG
ncbi:MAG: cupin domain-containing protein [Deltaproteobacteria bacterium]|nr:cupin domain-containing protein [Deltaproteobacteria bacterium]MBW2396768.1 cupin domain-containing protein [Deltaproteobacteria bacterium]